MAKLNLLPYEEVMEWAKEELENGNRVKAAYIQKAAEKMKVRYEKEQEKNQQTMYY